MNRSLLIKAWENLSKTLKNILPPHIYYKTRRSFPGFSELLYGKQLMMELSLGIELPPLSLPAEGFIQSFQDFPYPDEWVNIVNNAIGEWDIEAAKHLFFDDRNFSPELCLFLFDRGRPVATASGRIRDIKGVRTGEIHMVAVRPDTRGRGFGYAISLAALYRIRDIYHGHIILRTDHWRLPAIKMYWKLGFRPVKIVGRCDHRSIWRSIFIQLCLPFAHINCNVCGGEESKLLYIKNGYPIMKCKKCDLVFVNTSEGFKQNQLYDKAYYSGSVYADYESDRKVHQAKFDKLLCLIEKVCQPGKLIEIGSAFGFFMDLAKNRGWSCIGYEISKYATQISRDKYGIDVRNEDFAKVKISEQVDLICLLDTIEHLDNPHLYVSRSFEVLRSGGLLLLTTGDIDSPFAKLQGRWWTQMVPPFHLFYFSKKTIFELLDRIGFKIVSVNYYPKEISLAEILRKFTGKNFSLLPNWKMCFSLGDTMIVIARKP